jgi:predicted outer membrane lipoprotein
LHDVAAHAHRAAEQHGQEEHLTGHEHSRQALEHTEEAHRQTQAATVGHGVAAFGHNEIAALAYELWNARGRPDGSPEEDWSNAVKELRSRSYSH